MTQTAIDTELLELENRYWQAIKDRDVQGAVAMTENPCIIAGSSGVRSVDRNSFVKIMQSATYDIRKFTIQSGAVIREIAPGVATIAYKVREELILDDKPVTFEAADTSIWVRRGGTWLCAVHAEAVQGDAYGRDRRPDWKP